MAIAMKLKRKHREGISYKNQKSTSGNSGKQNKKKDKKRNKDIALNGKKIYVLNLSGVPQYCAATGRLLPKRGMVVEYNGQLYIDFSASSRASN